MVITSSKKIGWKRHLFGFCTKDKYLWNAATMFSQFLPIKESYPYRYYWWTCFCWTELFGESGNTLVLLQSNYVILKIYSQTTYHKGMFCLTVNWCLWISYWIVNEKFLFLILLGYIQNNQMHVYTKSLDIKSSRDGECWGLGGVCSVQ